MKRRQQQGFTLVELMIAATVSLTLLAGLFQIFISSKTAHNRVIAQARQQENGRFALNFMRAGLKNAGFRTTPEELPESRFSDASNPVVSGVDSTIQIAGLSNPTAEEQGSYDTRSVSIQVGSSTITETNVLTTSDVLTVRYQGGEYGADDETTIRNCLGTAINQLHDADDDGSPDYVVEYAVDTYYVGLSTSEPDGVNRFYLYCQHARWTSDLAGATQSMQGASREKLAADIVSLQVRLGVDTTGDNVVDVYQTFSDSPDLSRVRSAELSVVAKGGAPTDFLENRDAQTLTPTEISIPLREYTQLVNLRNLSR